MLYRSIMDHPDYFKECFTRAQAWMHLLMIAEWKETFTRFRHIRLEIERGQLVIPKTKLAEAFQWSKNKLRLWLDELEEDGQIKQRQSNLTTTITIMNYDLYQDPTQKNFYQKPPKKKTAKKQQKGQQNKSVKSIPVKVSSKRNLKKGIAKSSPGGIAALPKNTTSTRKTGIAIVSNSEHKKGQQKIAGKSSQQKVSHGTSLIKGIAKSSAEGIAKSTADGTTDGTADGTLLKEVKKFKKLRNTPNKEKQKIQGGNKPEIDHPITKKYIQMTKDDEIHLCPEMLSIWKRAKPGYPADQLMDFPPLLKIANYIARHHALNAPSTTDKPEILKIWGEKAREIADDSFDGSQPLYSIAPRIQKYFNKETNGKTKNSRRNSATTAGKEIKFDKL